MLMWDTQFRRLLRQVAAGKTAVRKAVGKLLYEWARLPFTYILDETTQDLDVPLAMRNYQLAWVSLKWRKKAIKKWMQQGIYITRKGEAISKPKDMERYYYGVVWVTAPDKGEALAQKVEKALMAGDFLDARARMVKVEGEGQGEQRTGPRERPEWRKRFTRLLTKVSGRHGYD